MPRFDHTAFVNSRRDERGLGHHTLRAYATSRKAVVAGRLLRVTGRIERDGQVIHIAAEKIENLSPPLATLGAPTGAEKPDDPDEKHRGQASGGRTSARHLREQAKELFPSRDFH